MVNDLINKPKVILIDSSSVGARALFTMGSLSYKEMPTGVIYGFLKTIQDIATEFKTNDFMFFWDSKKSLRRELFPEYKIKRVDKRTKKEKEMWEIAYEQYDNLRLNILPNFGWLNQFISKGYEADDLLHQAASQLHKNHEVIMVTTDEDMYQTLEYCSIYKPSTKKEFDQLDFINKYGINSSDWSTVKALAGCKSDEVPGIPGIGEKKAIQFIRRELKRSTKAYQSIISELGREIVKRNRPLVTLPFEGLPELEFWENDFNFDAFVKLCDDLGMVSLLGHYSRREWETILNDS